jgi:WD40 repeat protein
LRLIEILTGRTMLTFDESSAPSTSIALSPDGSMLAAPDDDAAVSIWSTDSGLRLATLTGHAGSVSDLTFSADGAWLITSSTDGTVRRWELDITT